jgi:hypothetical protein
MTTWNFGGVWMVVALMLMIYLFFKDPAARSERMKR